MRSGLSGFAPPSAPGTADLIARHPPLSRHRPEDLRAVAFSELVGQAEPNLGRMPRNSQPQGTRIAPIHPVMPQNLGNCV